jgi:hypothetical protein
VPATPRALRATSYAEWNGRFSPDGHLIAFHSDESGKNEIYIARYAADGTLGPPLMVSSGGAAGGAWSADSRRFLYANPDGRLVSVTVNATPALSASAPVVTLDLKKMRVTGWDVLPDGRVFGIQRAEGEDDIASFSVVLNWFDELRALLAKRGAK